MPPNPLELLSNLTSCDFLAEDPLPTLRESFLHVVSERLDPWFFILRDELTMPTWTATTKRVYESNIQDILQEILAIISVENTTAEPYLQSRQLLTSVRRLVSFTNIAQFASLEGATRDLYEACVIYFNSVPIPERLQVCPPPPMGPGGPPPPMP